MNQQIKLLFITAGFATLSGCGGGGSASSAPVQAPALPPALAPVAAPGYIATDASCVAALATSSGTASVGKIDDVAAYFGSYSVSLSSGGTTTFTLQQPGTATLKGVTTNIKSVCFLSGTSANWRYVSLVDGNTMNLDTAITKDAKSCVNGNDFSVTGPRGSFDGCKP